MLYSNREEELYSSATVSKGPQHRSIQQPGERDTESDRETRQGDDRGSSLS